MTKQGVLLDTSFIIRLMDESDPLHKNAVGYFKHFLENDKTHLSGASLLPNTVHSYLSLPKLLHL